MAVGIDTESDRGVTFQLWDTKTWSPLPARKPVRGVDAIPFSPDGLLLAEVEDDNRLTLRDASNNRVRRATQLRSGLIRSIAFSPTNHELAVSYDDGYLELLNSVTLHVVRSKKVAFEDPYQSGDSICFSPDGERLAVCEKSGFRIYSTATWRIEREFKVGTEIANVAFFSNDQLAVNDSNCEHNWVAIYDLETGQATHRLKSTALVCSVAVSTDRKMIAIGGMTSKAQIWDAGSGRLIRAFDTSIPNAPDTSEDEGPALTFGPAGRILATTVTGGIGIWNVSALCRPAPHTPTARPFLTLRGAAAPAFFTARPSTRCDGESADRTVGYAHVAASPYPEE